ncbi:hypothetical protein SESBI_48163, partial [Sesbania bispinosa]
MEEVHNHTSNVLEREKNIKITVLDNNLKKMKEICQKMPHDICSKFEKKYGRIKDLLLIRLETSVLSALAQFWNSNLRYFELPSLDMVPTIEEYDVMLGLPVKEKAKVYLYQGSYVAKRK